MTPAARSVKDPAVVAGMATCADACFYCDRPLRLTVKHEHDHVPTPRRHGGSETHCVCRECHSLVFTDWPVELFWQASVDAWKALSPEGRIYLAKLVGVVQDMLERRDQLRELEKTFEAEA